MKKLLSTLLILMLVCSLCLALSACGDDEEPTIDVCEHADSDGDGKCDECGKEMKSPEDPEEPVDPEQPVDPEEPVVHTHNLTKILAVSATCTENGNIEYYACSGCDKLFSDAEGNNEITDVTIPAVHTGSTEIRNAKEATEDEEGYTGDTYCLGCNSKLSSGEAIDKLPHTHNIQKIEAVTATCAVDGNIEYWMCAKCEKLYSDENGNVEIAIADTVIFAAHIGGTEIRNAKEATEDEEGYTGDTYCLGCNTKLSSGEVIDKLPHTHNMQKIDAVTATCAADGNIEYWTCIKCEKIYSDENGNTEITVADTVIKVEHNIVDNACTNCDFHYTEGLKYRLNGNEYTVIGIGSATDTDLFIPPSYNGLPVTEIGSSAFAYCGRLVSVTIPDSITSIGDYAFKECSSLTVYCEATLKPSGWNYSWNNSGCPVVWDCKNNDIASDGCIYTVADGIRYALKDGIATVVIQPININTANVLSSITFKNTTYSVTSICEKAFYNCGNLVSVTIPYSITSIGDEAFYDCTALAEINFNATAMDDLVENSDVFYNAGKDGKGIKVTIGKNVTKIPACLYSSSYATKIVSVEFEEGSVCESIGSRAFFYCDSLVSVTIPDSVTSIGYGAFENCTILTSITIPDSVTSIGSSAFEDCTSLTSVTIGKSVTSIDSYAFRNCTSLTEINFNAIAMNDLRSDNHVFSKAGVDSYGIGVNIGKNVTKIPARLFYPYHGSSSYAPKLRYVRFEEGSICESIGFSAFESCSSLESATIPYNVTSIGKEVFKECSNLTIKCEAASKPSGWDSNWNYSGYPVTWGYNNITTNSDYDYIVHNGKAALTKYKGTATEITIPSTIDGYEVIRFNSIFAENASITKVVISDVITYISPYAFYNCRSLTSVTIPDSVTSIGVYAFYSCTSLTSVTIGDNVTSIGEYAFYNCTSLTSVTIPDRVTNIGDHAFYNCKSLTSVYITDIAKWCAIDFYHSYSNPLYYAKNLYVNNTIVTELVIPDSVTSIGKYAFDTCTSLTSVTIPDSVETIGDYAFCDCSNLSKLTLGNSIEHIGRAAFAGCSITSVTIPDSVNSIGSLAFKACTSLTSVSIAGIGNSVTNIGEGAFDGCTSLASVYITDIAKWCAIDFESSDSNPLYYAKNLYVNNTIVTELVIPDSVTSIGSFVFKGYTNLTSVTIGKSVTSIGYGAFENCTSLTEINFNATAMNDLSSNNRVFYNAGKNGEGIKVTIGKNVTKIPAYLFCPYSGNISYSPKIVSLEFEEGSLCESIGDYAFYNCVNLTEINFNATAMDDLSSDNYIFYNAGKNGGIKVTIGKNVTKIPAYLFSPKSSDSSSSLKIVSVEFEEGSVCESIGSSAFYGCTSLTSVYISDLAAWCNIDFESSDSNPLYYAKNLYLNGNLIAKLVIPDGITEIKAYAFYGCNSLVSVTIPDSVASISDFAFYGCDGFTSVYISDLVAWCNIDFKDSSSNPLCYAKNLYLNGNLITELVIPDGVTEIKAYAFSGCNNLVSVAIPDSVSSIGDYAFSSCDSFTSVYISDLAAWCNIDFKDSSSNPLCYAKNLYLNGNLITALVIPDDITEIKAYAFSGCDSLVSVTIPDSKTSINDYAFSNCDSLISVTIPGSVISISDSAFSNCDSFTDVYISDLTAWCNIDFESSSSNPLYYAKNLYLNGNLITELVIPDGVTEIKAYAFSGCDSLVSVTIPDSVTSISDFAFYGCDKLVIYCEATSKPSGWDSKWNYSSWVSEWNYSKCPVVWKCISRDVADDGYIYTIIDGIRYALKDSVAIVVGQPINITTANIPSDVWYEYDSYSVTSISDYAFRDCRSLTSVTIGNSVASIGYKVFYGCDSLTSIGFRDTSDWYRTTSSTDWSNKTGGTSISVANASANATYFISTYKDYYWYKK